MAEAAQRGYAKGRARRADIIERAATLFGETGYRGTSLREIAARSGISHPGLLHHFPTKEALLIAVLERRHQQRVDRVFTPTTDGVDRLRGVVDIVDVTQGQRGIVELFVVLAAEAAAAQHPARDFFVRRYRTTVAGIEEAYRQARAAGALRDHIDPLTAARELVALIDGLQLQWLLDGGATPMAAVVRSHLQDRLTVPL